jgi:small conductance mechanosensitive channel
MILYFKENGGIMKPLFMLAAEVVNDTAQSGFADILKFWQGQDFKDLVFQLIIGVIIFIVSWIALKLIIRSIKMVLGRSKKVSELMVAYLLKIFSVIGWLIIALIILQHIGINMGPLIAGLGVTGVVLGFALQDSLSNFFAGAMLVINEPFRKGDYIEIGAISGSVVSMDLMCVILSTPDGKRIILSNKLVWGVAITNYSYTTKRGVNMIVSVAYNDDLTVCKDVIKDLLSSYPEILADPLPIIEVKQFSASSIDFMVRPWVKPEDYWKIHWRFHAEIVGKLAEKGINIPFPQVDVHFDKENK